MENIIQYQSQVPNVTAIPTPQASPDDFGAQIGQAVAGMGNALGGLSDALREHQNRSDGIDGQLALAKARQDMTQHLIGMENSDIAGTPQFTDHFNSAFDQYQQQAADTLPNNNKVRQAFQVGMAELRSQLSDRAMQSQASKGAAIQTQKAREGLSTYVNTIATDPTQYDAAVNNGNSLIDGLGLPPDKAMQLKEGFTNAAIAGRFDALFNAAKTPEAIGGIINDLENGPWKDRMSADKFHDLLNMAKTAQHSAQTAVNSQAEAAVTSVEDRIKGGAAIDPAEMASIGNAVKGSSNPLLIDKWARLQVQNDTTQRLKGMSSAAVGDYMQSNLGNAPATSSVVNTRAQDGYSYLMSQYHLSPAAAVGVLANIGRETGFNPRPGDGGTSDGYFQWHNQRMTAAGQAGALGTDIRRAIDFAMSEPEGQAFLARAGYYRSPAEAAQAWMAIFEKPANPNADQPVNERWAEQIGRAVNGGVPLPGNDGGQYPSEYAWLRGQTAKQVLDRRQTLVNQGNMITAGSESGLFSLGDLNTPSDFQTRAQQSTVAQQFTGAPQNKPFTPTEVASFDQVMQSGSLQDKQTLLQNVASMGSAAPAAFKQIGEKNPVFSAVGGLSMVSPTVAQDVLRGVQSMQDNPDLKKDLEGPTGAGPGGTSAAFNSVVGNALNSVPAFAYQTRQAADALYVQRQGAKWNPDAYGQAVRDVLGAKAGDTGGGVVTINKQDTMLPPGVNGDQFQTMLHSLTPDDLVSHSIGGQPPTYANGKPADPTDIANEGKFVAISKGVYNVFMGDNLPLGGSGPNHLYAFQIDANGVQAIINRPTVLPAIQYDSNGDVAPPNAAVQQALPGAGAQNSPLMSTDPNAVNPPPSSFWSLPSMDSLKKALHLETQ